MKKINLLFSLIMATMLLLGGSAYAQGNAFTDAIDALKLTGGGTYTLTGNVTINAASDSYVLESTPAAPIIIECGTYTITATGSGISLTVGDNVTINGSATAGVLNATTSGKIIVAGGKVTNSVGDGIRATSGPILVSGGTVETTAITGNPCTLWTGTQDITVTGGTIIANGNGRCIRSSGTVDVSNATFYANDGATYALHCNSATTSVYNLSGTIAFYGEGIGINFNGTSKIYMAAGTVIDNQMTGAGKLLSGTSANAVVFDYNAPFEITADTPDATTFPDAASGNVTITIENPNGNEYPGYVGMYYTIDGSIPTSTSSYIGSTNSVAATASIPITQATTEIKARIGRSGVFWDETTVFEFTYHVANIDVTHPTFTAANFAQLKAAYEASQESGVESSTIIIGGSFTIPEPFNMTPASDHPVTIDHKNTVTTGNGTVFGGALTINIEANPLYIGGNTTFNNGVVVNGSISGSPDIRTSGSPVLTFNGGEFNANATGTFIQLYSAGAKAVVYGGNFASSGTTTFMQISSATASIEINGGTFTVNGTGTNARAFQVSSGGGQITINDGTIAVGAGGRAITLSSAGTLKIYGGSITMGGSNNASQIIRIDNNNTNQVEINGGTFDTGRGNLIAFGGNQNNATCIIRAATVELGGGTAYVKNGPGDGSVRPGDPVSYYGVQKIYDFRGFNIIPSVAAGPIPEAGVSVGLSLSGTVDPDPVDAAGAVIYYNTGGSSTDKAYSTPISVIPGTTLNVSVRKDGHASLATPLSYTPTGITNPSVGEAAYIVNNMLYLPESAQSVQVYAVGGQLVLNAVALDKTVDLSSLNGGIYIVKAGASIFKVVK